MVTVYALGNAEICIDELRLTPGSVRKFAFMLYLAVHRGQRVPRVTLRELLFPDQTETNSKHSLRELAYQFRRLGVPIVSDKEGIDLAGDAVNSDVDTLIASDRLTLEQLRAAEGGLLPGYAPEHSEAFTEWLDRYRARTLFEVCKTLVKEIGRARRVSDWMMTERAARACLALNPLHEEATLALAEMLALGGAKAQAVDLLDQYAHEVGQSELRLPVNIAKRRISERMKDVYRAPLALPFLGRDREMELLNDRFERAKEGESQCVVLVGDAGIGKTRIAEEFCTQATLNGARVERVVTQPHDRHRPMGTFTELVPRLLQLPGAIGCSPESMAALRRLTTHQVDGQPATPTDVSSEVVSSTIARAISDLLDALSSETMLVLLVDDVQWADELSQRMLSVLLSARHPRRFMAILTSRDREVAQFFARRSDRVLSLPIAPLAEGALRDLLERVVRDDANGPDAELRQWFAYASGGNPFFLRCLLGHFLSTGERFVVPTTVSSLLDQQVASLGPEATAVLDICVALGRHADMERIVAALQLPHIQLQIAVRELEAAYLIVQRAPRIEPAHWLVAEATLRSTTQISQQLLHRRVATVLEQDAGDSHSASQLWDCAEHWLLAGEQDRAAQLMRACATHAIEIGRPREAAEILLRAAASVGGDHRRTLITEALQIADSAVEGDIILRGVRLARSLNVTIKYDGFELAEIVAHIGAFEDTARATEHIRASLDAGKPIHHRIRAGLTAVMLAEHHSAPALAHEAFAALSPYVAEHSGTNDTAWLKFLVIYHSTFGDIETSGRLAHRMLNVAEDLEPAMAADLQRKAAIALLRSGDVNEAMDAFRMAYSSAESAGLLRIQCLLASMFGGLCLDVDDDESAELWMQRAQEMSSLVPEYRDSFPHAASMADMACIHDNPEAIRKWRDIAIESLRNEPTNRTRRWISVFNIRIRQLEKDTIDVDRSVAELLGHHAPGAETGDVSDAEVAVAIHVLAADGQIDRSHNVLRQYLTTFRRSRGPLARSLKNAARVVGWDGDAAIGSRSPE